MLVLALHGGAARGGVAACTGDCNDDKVVGIGELISMVNVALGRAALDVCINGDSDRDGTIAINELIRAVGNALEGCRPDIEPLPFKNRVDHPFDPYLAFSPTFDGPSWIKFTIRVDQPEVVYFQNSSLTPFHYDFVAATLEPYIGRTPAEIDALSLHADGQELVFGAVLYSVRQPFEIAIQLVRRDAYDAADVITYFDSVRASVNAAPEVPFFYFPTFEQQASAVANRATLEAAGIQLGSTARWLDGDVCYNFGWAHGRVVFVGGDEIDDAYADGRLGPSDILLTDGVPAEIPFVAGILSTAPSTPNSHVAILAADWGVPFAFLASEETAAAAQALVDRDVILRATTLQPRFFIGADFDLESCQIQLVDVTGRLNEDLGDYLSDLKRAPDLAIRPFVLSGTYTAEVATATPDDIVTIGGKAANYGFLLREIPNNARPAMAFTFDLWSDYLDQPLDGVTLRQRIATLLAPFPSYPPASFTDLYAALDTIRDLIDDEADFTPAQRAVIVEALERFDPNHRIRFRSSTNVEDSDVFTGAGLYESKSGCLPDDLDADDEGPSICEPDEENERGVFRALRKVFASFYNDNAFLERLRHRVDESQVGMAVLVHHNFPDETELANGVAVVQTSASRANLSIVTQPGAFSVTNPEDDGAPEIVDVFIFTSSTFPQLRQGAERLPLGATVLRMPEEYVELTNLLTEVGQAFGRFHGESQFDIEFEFKKITGEGLVVKQVRRIPRTTAPEVAPVLIDTPATLCTFQGEYGDVFANYRLKSRWRISFEDSVLEDTSPLPFSSAEHDYVVGGAVQTLNGPPSAWSEAQTGTFDPQNDGVLGYTSSWSVGDASAHRGMTLKTMVPKGIGPTSIPIVFTGDLGFTLEAEHDAPVPYRHFDGEIRRRSTEDVWLVACADGFPLTERHLPQSRTFTDASASISTDFIWPPSPTGAVAGYTAPLDRWTATAIGGVTDESTALSGYFSQTYRPEHHNFTENFIFDPHLEEGIDPSIVAAWDGRGIQALIKPAGFDNPPFQVITHAGSIVDLAELP